MAHQGGEQIVTGCGRDAFETAELRLHEYNIEKHASNPLGVASPSLELVFAPHPLVTNQTISGLRPEGREFESLHSDTRNALKSLHNGL